MAKKILDPGKLQNRLPIVVNVMFQNIYKTSLN